MKKGGIGAPKTTLTGTGTDKTVVAKPKAGGRKKMNAVLFWVAIMAAVVSLLAVASVDSGGVETDSERISRMSNSFSCPVCNGESVAESNAAVSVTIRNFIADEVAAGATDMEIRDSLVSSYGVEVLLNPPADGFSALLWVLPVVVVVMGSVGVAAAVTRGRQASRDPSQQDRELVSSLLPTKHETSDSDDPRSVGADSDGE